MSPRPTRFVFAAALFAVVSVAQAGDLYQWKDAKGVTHYSDAPPPAGQYRSRSVHANAGVAAPVTAAQEKPITATSAKCVLARANLDRLGAGGNLGPDADGDGKPDSTFTAEQIEQQKQLAQKNIQAFCDASSETPAQ